MRKRRERADTIRWNERAVKKDEMRHSIRQETRTRQDKREETAESRKDRREKTADRRITRERSGEKQHEAMPREGEISAKSALPQ
jgi:rubrerythrin